MTKWVWTGIRTGLKTTPYPSGPETAPGVSPGRPVETRLPGNVDAQALTRICPAGALRATPKTVQVDGRRCLHCLACGRPDAPALTWAPGFEWAAFTPEGTPLGRAFAGSMHIRVVDAGACGACMGEIGQITTPYYNIHRLGFFITPTPRSADVLVVAGPLTEHMVDPLRKTYEAMPGPKRVIAVGTCALSGGPFGAGFACRGGVGEVVPVDVEVPGCPPPPLAIIHALLLIAGKVAGPSEKGGQ